VAEFKYLGAALTDKNCMQEEIKMRLNSGNASRLLSRNIKVKLKNNNIILPVVLYGCETVLSH
jgi:hypothetical protein